MTDANRLSTPWTMLRLPSDRGDQIACLEIAAFQSDDLCDIHEIIWDMALVLPPVL